MRILAQVAHAEVGIKFVRRRGRPTRATPIHLRAEKILTEALERTLHRPCEQIPFLRGVECGDLLRTRRCLQSGERRRVCINLDQEGSGMNSAP